MLQNNAGNDLAVSSNGSFTFDTALVDGTDYAVTVKTQPSNLSQTCDVSNGGGTLAGADIITVQVTCTTDTFTIGGTVTGLLTSGIILQLNDDELVSIASNQAYTFKTELPDGSAYSIAIYTQPIDPELTCELSNSSGSIAGANITNVDVTCKLPSPDLIFKNGFEDQLVTCPEDGSVSQHDLRSGVPSWFNTYSDNQYWTVTTDAELGLVVSKPADDGTQPADLFTTAGMVANCKLSGDFTVQASYDWQTIIIPTFRGATGTDLLIDFPESGERARVLNYSSWVGYHRTNACDSSTCPRTFSAPFTGIMKAIRTGDELTFYATDLDGALVSVATFTGSDYEGPAIITIRGRQGLSTIEPRDAMSVSFESLSVEASGYSQ